MAVAVVAVLLTRTLGNATFPRQAIIVAGGIGVWLLRIEEMRYFLDMLVARFRRPTD